MNDIVSVQTLIERLQTNYAPDELVTFALFSKADLKNVAGERKWDEIWDDIIVNVSFVVEGCAEEINNAIEDYVEEWRLNNGK